MAIERLPANTDPEQIAQALRRDGAAIVDGIRDPISVLRPDDRSEGLGDISAAQTRASTPTRATRPGTQIRK